jgi:hypothetical protein
LNSPSLGKNRQKFSIEKKYRKQQKITVKRHTDPELDTGVARPNHTSSIKKNKGPVLLQNLTAFFRCKNRPIR